MRIVLSIVGCVGDVDDVAGGGVVGGDDEFVCVYDDVCGL